MSLCGIQVLPWMDYCSSLPSHSESTRILTMSLLMIKSVRELLCPRGQSKIAKLLWLRHHLAQSFHTELQVASPAGRVYADACVLRIQLCFPRPPTRPNASRSLQPGILDFRAALRLRTCLGPVSDDPNKVFRIAQPLESLYFDVHYVSLQVPSVFHCTWSDSVEHFDSPSAMMSSPWIAAIESASKQEYTW